MRAFAITGPSQGEVREVPTPIPGAGQVLIRTGYVGICGTDYHIWKGDFLTTAYPLTNGHEFTGVVEGVGAGVARWREGDRVAVDPTLICTECYYCQRRQTNHCERWGAIGDTTAGALAEYVVAPARNLYRLEDDERMDHAAFTEPLACVVWGVERLRMVPGSRVLVFGAGPIGLMLTRMLSSASVSDVVAVDTMEEKLSVARQMGARATFATGPDLGAQLRERSNGRGFDVVVDCTGIPAVIGGMFSHAGPGAKIMFFGVASPGAQVTISPFDVYHQDWEILGSMAINTTFQRARDLMASGELDLSPLLTTRGGLDDVAGILARPKTPAELKTMIAPNGA